MTIQTAVQTVHVHRHRSRISGDCQNKKSDLFFRISFPGFLETVKTESQICFPGFLFPDFWRLSKQKVRFVFPDFFSRIFGNWQKRVKNEANILFYAR
jgi:hypothetical protein